MRSKESVKGFSALQSSCSPVSFVQDTEHHLVLTRITAAAAPVAYPLKGVDVAVSKLIVKDPEDSIRSARIVQGEYEYAEAREEKRQAILSAWESLRV